MQIKRLTPLKGSGPTSGPDAFIYSLISSLEDSPILILSRFNTSNRVKYGNIDARVFKVTGNVLEKLVLRSLSVIWMFFHLIVFKPDRILCGTTGGPLWISYIVSKIYNVSLVHSRHNSVKSSESGFRKRLSSSIDSLVLRNISAFITHGPYLRDQLKSIGIPDNRIFEFDVGFEDMMQRGGGETSADLSSIVGTQTLNSKNKIVLYMGRIERDKGVQDLLDALADQLERDSKLTLVYVGDGSYKQELSREIALKTLDKRVRVLGYIDHDRLVDLLRICRVVVTPTQKCFPEGRCMSAMEGLVMEVPVIAPDFGPFPYLVQHGVNGLLYKVDCIEDLKEKLVSTLVDNDLYNTLREGAKNTSKRIIRPPLTFGDAAECAFSL